MLLRKKPRGGTMPFADRRACSLKFMRVPAFALIALTFVLVLASLTAIAQNPVGPALSRLVEVTGIRREGKLAIRYDIFLKVDPFQDEAALTNDALAREGALPLNSLPKFALTGQKWPQFFDQNQSNDVVWQSYNPDGQPVIGDPIVALQSAETEWTNVNSSSYEVAYNGSTTLGAGLDGTNVLSWPSVWNHSPLAFAVTLTFYDQATGYILDSDIVFNRNYNFFSQPSQLTPDRIDIRYVMLHENGHVAGLDHSGDPSAVMNVQFMPGVVGHGLALDDIDAISTLYPATSNFPPAILMEQNSSNAAAFDSVTFVRGPFSILTPNNFSADGHRRIIFFTSNLKLAQQQNPDASVISVQASGVPLMVENVGPLTGVAGLNASFIVVRLPDQLTPGTKDLTVTLRGTTSTATTFAVQ
jgi:matrixin